MRTIPQMFEDSVKLFPENPLIREKVDGQYISFSFLQVREKVYQFGYGLINIGVQKGDRVAILSEGRTEWLVSEFGILYTGAIAVPLSVNINEQSELEFRLKHSGCSYIIVSANQLVKVREIRQNLHHLKKVIVIGNDVGLENEILFDKVVEKGQKAHKEIRTDFEARWNSLKEDDLANISYTSGTTADPKGIMLTHRNYTANVEQANSLFDVPEWYITLLILPWDHSFAHTVGLYVLLKNGASFAVVDPGKSPMERLRNIPKNLKEIKPSIQLSVPALARSFKKNIEAGIRARGAQVDKLFQRALKLSTAYHGDGYGNKSFKTSYLKPVLWFYDKILFSKIRENFGGQLQFFVGGGALLDIELQHFFYAIGMPMFQGYGLTEAAPIIASNTPKYHKLGSSGRVVKNLEIRIEDENGNLCSTGEKGEIVVKGENVMKGYWKNEEATKETLIDGWLHTGDMGYLDEDGFLFVLGRFKSLLIGNDGEKYSPEGIEESLIDGSKFIDQCMLYNNQNAFTTGLFVPNKSALINELKAQSLKPDTEEGIRAACELLKVEVAKYFKGGEYENVFPERWMPAAVGILDVPFTKENGMINSTLKMVRSKVIENNREFMDFLYTTEGKKIDSSKNRDAIKRLMSN